MSIAVSPEHSVEGHSHPHFYQYSHQYFYQYSYQYFYQYSYQYIYLYYRHAITFKSGFLSFLMVLMAFFLSGCLGVPEYQPAADQNLPMQLGRIQTTEQHGVTVEVSIPTDDKASTFFGVPMAEHNLQPIWLKITNNSDADYWLLPNAIDPNYYSADEAARVTAEGLSSEDRINNTKLFRDHALPFHSSSGKVIEGYVYATYARGGRLIDVRLKGKSRGVRVRFAMLLPTEGFDYEKSELRERYANRHQLPDLTLEQTQVRLRELPCCTTNESLSATGDPLNIVLIGSGEDVIAALSSSGWAFTEAITVDSIRRMIGAAIAEKAFLMAPVSALYAFGRKQDVALQRGRSNINQRNHLRLWMAPFRSEGKAVWVGQISRDIGVKLTPKSSTLTTHVIDPVVDEAREYLLDSLLQSDAVGRFAFVQGVGKADADNPKVNLTDDPYFTDGLRLIVWPSSQPVTPEEALDLDWNDSIDPILHSKGESQLQPLADQ
ncbi:LssY C-terminal domain-containing protein [Pseudomaricurvus sp.]|uniref:LssY C-terminal domain-containing protein n=1 Tax=Pseudomaricurvus sp. TaxID=2004510 RepID=UPI003F6AAFE7